MLVIKQLQVAIDLVKGYNQLFAYQHSSLLYSTEERTHTCLEQL